jgi:hypothetical protein
MRQGDSGSVACRSSLPSLDVAACRARTEGYWRRPVVARSPPWQARRFPAQVNAATRCTSQQAAIEPMTYAIGAIADW